MIKTGIKGTQEVLVTDSNTASAFESGTLEVFATPALAALMEKTAQLSVADYLDEGFTTVGTALDIQHVSATPIGMKVTCESELIEVDRKKLVFSVRAFDDCGDVGTGTHTRFIVQADKFANKSNEKLDGTL